MAGTELKIALSIPEHRLQDFVQKTNHLDRTELLDLLEICQGNWILPPENRTVPLVRLSDAEAALAERDAEIEQLKTVITDLRGQLETLPSPDVEQED